MGKFKKVLLFAIIVLVAIAPLGCGKAKSPSGNQQGQNQEAAQTGGELVIGSTQEPVNLNPLVDNSLATSEVSNLIFDGLVKINDQMRWVPDLAEEVPTIENGGVSADGREVTYKLRKNVKWQDGEPFTADDVVFTYHAIINSGNKATPKAGYAKIASVDAIDPYTVKVTYSEPYPGYLLNFPYILPKHLLENESDITKATAFNNNPIGTGPFRLKGWKKGEYLLFGANPDYFLGQPKLSSIRIDVVYNSSALLLKLRTGEVDMICRVPEDQFSKLQNVKNIRSYAQTNLTWEHFDFNLGKSIFQDPKVREAIALGIDQQALVDQALNGAGTITPSSLPPLSWAYDDKIKNYGRNVDKARELLAQAGWKDVDNDGILEKGGRKLSFGNTTTPDDPIRLGVQKMIQDQLRQIGVDMKIQNPDPTATPPTSFQEMLSNRSFDTITFAWVLTPDPDQWALWHSKAAPPKGDNYIGYQNPDMDKVLDDGRATVDFVQRKQDYVKMQELLRKDMPVIPLYFHANVVFAKTTVQNIKPNPTNQTDFWNAYEWWIKK